VEITPYGPYGTVSINGEWVPDGTPVAAFCNGVEAGSGSTQTVAGQSRYSILVQGDNPDTGAVEGCEENDPVSFTVDGVPADQTGTWVEGGSEEINLTAFRPEPAIQVEKLTNEVDADEAPGPLIRTGGTVTWTVVVSNTGNVPLSGVAVSDDVLGTIDCPGTSLAVDQAITCETTGIAMAGQHANVATATATYESATVDDTDPSHYFGQDASITVEKATNGEDADAAPGVFLTPGDPVEWTYAVTNTGNITLTNVTVTDDEGVMVSCAQDTLASWESMTCTAEGTAEAGQYVNTATATGTPPVGPDVTDTDPSHYFGVTPGIDLEKATNGQDADTAPGAYVLVGDAVTWTYAVKNTGNITLTNISVTDDQDVTVDCPDDTLPAGRETVCTATGSAVEGPYVNGATVSGLPPVGPAVTDTDVSWHFGARPSLTIEKSTNDFDADEPTGPVLVTGDTVEWGYDVTNTGNVTLTQVTVVDDQGVSVSCPQDTLVPWEEMTCLGEGVAEAGQYANVGTVTGTPPGGLPPVSASDPSHYFAYTLYPSVRLEKGTNSSDGDTAPGPAIVVGETVTWTYQVANSGNAVLSNIVITDDNGTADNPADDWVACAIASMETYTSETCVVTTTAVLGQYANLGTVTAESELGDVVSDTDPSHYFGIDPSIAVEKATLESDADLPPGPMVLAGTPITWTFAVTNTGNSTLTEIALVDSREGPVPCDTTELEARKGFTCTLVGVAEVGAYANVVTATGTPPAGPVVQDTDPSHYFGANPSIAIDKRTEGPDGQIGDGITVDVGATITWTVRVTNTGNVTLTNVLVTDDREGEIACPKTVLVPDEGMICTEPGTAQIGAYANTVTVTADSPVGVAVEAHDTSSYFGAAPDVVIDKMTNGLLADAPPGPTILVGDGVIWGYIVTNTGNITLTGVLVSDDVEGAIGCPQTTLAPWERIDCAAQGTAVAGQYENTATVWGIAPTGRPVSATATSHYFGAAPGIDVEKAVSSDGVMWRDADDEGGALELSAGDPVWWRVTITNTGNVNLTVTVEDTRYGEPFDLATVCDPDPPEDLAVGAVYDCWFEDLEGAMDGVGRNAVSVGAGFAGIWSDAAEDAAVYVTASYRVYLPLVVRQE